MIQLVAAGISLIVAGALVIGTKAGRKLEKRAKSALVMKILGNLGQILFVIGILCIAAGLANLYYG